MRRHINECNTMDVIPIAYNVLKCRRRYKTKLTKSMAIAIGIRFAKSSEYVYFQTVEQKFFRYISFEQVFSFFLQGENGMLELRIDGGSLNRMDDSIAEETFEIAPSIIYNQRTPFVISVKNNKKLDYEGLKKIDFKVFLHVFSFSILYFLSFLDIANFKLLCVMKNINIFHLFIQCIFGDRLLQRK